MKLESGEFSQFNCYQTQGCLIVPIQCDLYDDFLAHLQKSILSKLQNNDAMGVVIDVSAVNIIDGFNLKALIKICDMIRLMGKESVFIGFQPNVAAAITELPNIELDKIITCMNLNAAITYLKTAKMNSGTPMFEEQHGYDQC